MEYLISPSPIQISRLKEPLKPRITPIDIRLLINPEQVLPISRRQLKPLRITSLVQTTGDLRNRKVIIRIFDRARDTARQRPKSHGVNVLHGDIMQGVPASQAAAAFRRPVERLFGGVFADCCVAGFPVDAVLELFDVCVCENDVCVGAALCVAFLVSIIRLGQGRGCTLAE